MKNLFYISIVSALFLTGCGEGACCEQNIKKPLGQSKKVSADNITPVARITNLPQRTDDCSLANASAATSSDVDGNVTAYSWSVDGVFVSNQITVDGILPCENNKEAYNVCLRVTDDKNATGDTCQNVVIFEAIDPIDPIDPVDPVDPHAATPIIQLPNPYRWYDDFIFDACGIQDFSPHVTKAETSDADTTGYLWSVTRHFEDGQTRTHEFYSCKKWIDWSKDANKFVKLDVSLTVRFTDGHENTTTSNYFPNEEASDLDIVE